MDYGDSEEVVLLPDTDEVADQTTDDDVVQIGDCPSAIQTSIPAGVNDDEITNTQETTDEGIEGKKSVGLKMALCHVILRFWLLGGFPRVPRTTSLSKRFRGSYGYIC